MWSFKWNSKWEEPTVQRRGRPEGDAIKKNRWNQLSGSLSLSLSLSLSGVLSQALVKQKGDSTNWHRCKCAAALPVGPLNSNPFNQSPRLIRNPIKRKSYTIGNASKSHGENRRRKKTNKKKQKKTRQKPQKTDGEGRRDQSCDANEMQTTRNESTRRKRWPRQRHRCRTDKNPVKPSKTQ